MTILQKLRLQTSWRGVMLGVQTDLWDRDDVTTAGILSEYNTTYGRLGRPKWRLKLFTPGTMLAEYWKWEGDRNDLVVPEQS